MTISEAVELMTAVMAIAKTTSGALFSLKCSHSHLEKEKNSNSIQEGENSTSDYLEDSSMKSTIHERERRMTTGSSPYNCVLVAEWPAQIQHQKKDERTLFLHLRVSSYVS